MIASSVLAFILIFGNVFAANILYIAPLASPSHHLWNTILAKALIEKNHNITMLSHDVHKGPPVKNLTVITMAGIYEILHQTYDLQEMSNEGVLSSILTLYNVYSLFICEYDYQTEGLQTLLNYPPDYKFDLIIYDVTLGQCLYPIIERFNNPPVIAVTAFLLPPVLGYSFGNHLYTSYMPYYATDYTNYMSLHERVLNFVYIYFEIFYKKYFATPKEYKLAQKRFGENIKPFEEVERNIGMLLANIDPILDYPLSLPTNIVPVGGMHIKPAKALPKDLRDIVANAKHGVILFSLGTNIRSDTLKEKERRALLDAFSKLPQTVVWKFESDDLEGRPKNVIIRKWLPQNDILGHPNTKLFISHGGGLSTQEAIYHGVPVVGMPFFIDQHVNVGKMVKKNLAKFLDYRKLTSEMVHKTIKEILDNPMYSQEMKRTSKLYRDRLEEPLDKAVFWTEYVLRHGGAGHLVTRARDMPFYQTANLDVVAVFVIVLVLIYSILMLVTVLVRFAFTLQCKPLKLKTVK